MEPLNTVMYTGIKGIVSRDWGRLQMTTAMLTTAMLTTGMPDCPASSQFGTGLRKTNDAGTDPVPE
jgi:hypothetical protein